MTFYIFKTWEIFRISVKIVGSVMFYLKKSIIDSMYWKVMTEARYLQLALLKRSRDCHAQFAMPNDSFRELCKLSCLTLCVFQTQFVDCSDDKSEPIIDAEYRRKWRL